ncbi:Signal recognition particle receptor FtsY [Metallosphaera sp. J1]|uniref:signal recognition particle-docking protein FtsY n=1 Tax=Metallosphaera javensis (ex Hofmann et al. 2022) TaxID=99938 RepID=UPI001EDFB3BE|nr:signal recognition particle-docking protein FtsY [Metallosphaera javensis (ex Hofmann et al. 2022)]MCG3109530.1 Signal recognition particle receptor FtsY [Metallosphaera javensis (ex Hofmann et al. 2022)]
MNCFDRLKKAFSSFTEKLSNKFEKEESKEDKREQVSQLAQSSVPQENQAQQQTPQQAQPQLDRQEKEEKPEIKEREEKQEQKSGLFGFLRYREIKEDDISDLIEELRIELLEDDVSMEVTDKILEDLKNSLVGQKVSRKENLEELIQKSLKKSLREILRKNYREKDVIDTIKSSKKPYVIVFFGVNGVGKTTTIAKFAMMLRKSGLSVIIAASDTFRAAAQEQLAYHASKLEVPLVKGKYGGDPASVAFDAIQSAKSRGIDVVLVDTAGRMHTDKDLTEELKRVVRIAKPDLKILVLDSLAGNDALQQAEYFEKNVGYDAVILTKVDADAKGGVALSLAYKLGKPVIYLGMGQDYDSLVKFDPDWFADRLLS